MATLHTLSGKLVDLKLSPLAPRTQHVIVKTNMPGGHPVMDGEGNLVMPTTRVPVEEDGSWSVDLIPTNATDLNIEPDTLQYTLVAEGSPEGVRSSTALKVGPFPLTSSMRIDQVDADSPAISPSWRSAFLDEMEQIKDEVRDISGIDTPDALVATLVPASSGSATSAALNAAIAGAIADDDTVHQAAIDALNDALEAGEGTPPVVTVRTNLSDNPTGATAGGWTVPALYGTMREESTTVTRRAGAPSWATQRAATSPSNQISQINYVGQTTGTTASSLAVDAGGEYTASLYVAASVAARARTILSFYDASGALVESVTGDFVEVGPHAGPGDFVRLAVTGTAPAGAVTSATSGQAYLPTDGVSVGGETAWWQDHQLEQGATLGGYFDGDFPAAPPAAYAWTGAPHASPSTETVTTPGTPGLDVEPRQAGEDIRDRVLVEWAQAQAYQPVTVTRDATGMTAFAVVSWPDGSPGELTVSRDQSGLTAGYTVTHTHSGKTVTQPTVTRDQSGQITSIPPLTVGA